MKKLNKNRKISIVIATYNGEKYIREQVQSILNQTVLPNEILIADDLSTDNTRSIIMELKKNSIIDIQVNFNTNNLGWKKNFYQLLKQVTGDIIFYCDQDDIWEKNKIENILKIFDREKNINCVMSNYKKIDEFGRYIGDGIKDKKDGYILPYDVKLNSAFGCLLAFKKNIKDYLNKIIVTNNDKNIPTDMAISRIAAFNDGLYFVADKLILHRFHADNASNTYVNAKCLSGHNSIDLRIESVKQEIELTKLAIKNKCYKYDLYEYKSYLEKRLRILTTGKGIISLLLFSSKVHSAFSIIIGDISYYYKINKFAGKIYNLIR